MARKAIEKFKGLDQFLYPNLKEDLATKRLLPFHEAFEKTDQPDG